MNAIVSHYVDKSQWPRGVWDIEPDGMQGYEPTTGLPIVIDRRKSGALIVGVGLPYAHARYGHDRSALVSITIHAGIDFAEAEGPTCPVRHFDPVRRWWVGLHFDHYGDRAPTESQQAWNEYRPWAYAEQIVNTLARTLGSS